jgi:DNA-binding Lrp family transcriptional regulator
MEEAGVIKGYQANLDRRMLGWISFCAHPFFLPRRSRPRRLRSGAHALPDVLSCQKITGSADYVLQVLAENLVSYSDFIDQAQAPGWYRSYPVQSGIARGQDQ